MDQWRHNELASLRVDLRLADSLGRLHGDVSVRVGCDCRQSGVVEASHVESLDFGLVLPETFHDAHLADQRVLERAVHNQKSVVVTVHHEVGVVCRLLRVLDVLGAGRDVGHALVGAVEHAHQRRHDRLYGIPYIHADNLAAAILLVAKRLASIVLRGQSSLWADPVVDVVDGVVDLAAYDAL